MNLEPGQREENEANCSVSVTECRAKRAKPGRRERAGEPSRSKDFEFGCLNPTKFLLRIIR